MFPVVPKTEQLLAFTDHINRWLGGGNVLRCHLFVNNFVPSPDNVLADYTEEDNVNFPGYAPIALTQSGTPFINPSGNVEQVWSDPLFQPSADPPTPQTIYGYFVTIHPLVGADTLLYGVKLDVPVIVGHATDAVLIDPDQSQVAVSSPASQ